MSKASTKSVATIAAGRLGAGLGLLVAVAFMRGFWQSALESFHEGIVEGIGGIVLALVVTLVALALVYGTLGTWVEEMSARLLAIAAGQSSRGTSGGSSAWIADALAALAYPVLGLASLAYGIVESHATYTILGFAGLALGAVALLSSAIHLFGRRARRRNPSSEVDATQIQKGSEIAAVFVSLAVLSLTLSSAIFSAVPAYRYSGQRRPLAQGDWADVCIGTAPGCESSKVLFFGPPGGQKTLLEVSSKKPAALRAKGGAPPRDASGAVVQLKRPAGESFGWQVEFAPPPGVSYEVILEEPDRYSVRYRRAP